MSLALLIIFERYTDLLVAVHRVDEPPSESSLSVVGQPGVIYFTSALQLNTELGSVIGKSLTQQVIFLDSFSRLSDILRR